MSHPIKTIRLFALKIKRANYGRAWKLACDAGSEIHKPAFFIILDMLWSSLRYGAAFTDYHMFKFYLLSGRERAKFLTMTGNNKLIAYMNDKKYRHYLDVKTDLVEQYKPFLHREVLVLGDAARDETISFLKIHPIIFAKKNYTFSAKGVERFSVSDFESEEELYNKLLSGGFDLIEEPIVQHEGLEKIYPNAVNTVRVVTVFINGSCDIVFAALKTGNKGFVDNMNAGGLSAAVDIDTGVVYTDAIIKGGGRTDKHPLTGVIYKGIQIPMWSAVKELVNQVVRVTPQLRFVGWDIAIGQDGPILVEGNYLPGYDLLQLPDMTGRKWILEKYVR